MRPHSMLVLVTTALVVGATAGCSESADDTPDAAADTPPPATVPLTAAPPTTSETAPSTVAPATSTASPSTPVATSAPAVGTSIPEAEVTAARAVLSTATMDAAGAATVEAIRLSDAGLAAAAKAIASGATGAELWAATWVYTSGATDPAPLLGLLDDGDPNVRVLAAAGALSMGESAAATALAGLLSDATPLAAGSPPLTVGQFAAYTLARYVDAPEIPDDAAPADLVAPWNDWLAAHAATMVFDPATGKWSR